MISISDGDKAKLEKAREAASLLMGRNGILSRNYECAKVAHTMISEVLESIDRLSHPAPYVEPRIVALSESDMRLAYPERMGK